MQIKRFSIEELPLEIQNSHMLEAKRHSNLVTDEMLSGDTAVTEAFRSIKEAPYYKIQRKLILPYNKDNASKGNAVFLNTPSLEDSLALLKNPIIPSNSHYQRYFIDYKYNMKILNKKYLLNNKKIRIPIYARLEKEYGISGVTTVEMCKGRNLYVDMHMYNDFYLKRENKFGNIKLKVEAFITMIKSVINDKRFNLYTNKTMIIPIAPWLPKETEKVEFNKKQFNNILFIFYYLMLKSPDAFRSIGDIDIVVLGDFSGFKFNPSKFEVKDLLIYKRLLNRISPRKIIGEKEDEVVTLPMLKKAVDDGFEKFKERYSFTGKNPNEKEEIDVLDEELNEDKEEEKELEKIYEKEATKKDLDSEGEEDEFSYDEEEPKEDDSKENEVDVEDFDTEKTFREIRLMREKKATGKTTASLKRDLQLRERQANLKLEGIRIGDVDKIPREKIKIPVHDVSSKVNTTNPNITKLRMVNYDKVYNETMYDNDIIRCFKSLNEKGIPVYILDIKKEDSSDKLNYKDTWTVKLEDENRQRHTIKVDMPKFIDNKFIYLGGNKKTLYKQQVMKPVVKTGPDTVQLCSSDYSKKIFITRHDTKSTIDVENLYKTIAEVPTGYKVKRGNASKNNIKHPTIYEYDELSKHFIAIETKNAEFLFNQDEVVERLKAMGKKVPDDYLCIGFSKWNGETQPITINKDTQTIDGLSICKYIANRIGDTFETTFNSKKGGKRAVYSEATIMKKKIPLVFLLSYLDGLTNVLNKSHLDHQFLDKKPKANSIYLNQDVIRFADGYLVYNNTPFARTLLFNGFKSINTADYEYKEFDEKEVYYDLFGALYGRKNLASALEQFRDFFIGPITKEVLDDLNYPTDFCELLIFANDLLSDNKYIPEMNFNNARIRSSEMLVAMLYEAIANAYLKYKNSAYNNSPTKISIPQNYVLKEAMTNQIIENYSKLNPIVELEKLHSCTAKGKGGMNLDDAFTLEKRAYDKSMIGIIGMSTPPDYGCGKTRTLALEPNIRNGRGYLDLNDDNIDSLKDVNLFTPGELLSPLGASKDDATRTAMAVKQSKHIIPVKKTSPVLISNGAEQVIQYHLSNDFVVTAEEDGVVREVNTESGIIIVEYNPKEKDKPIYHKAINIGKTIDKNGAGGFFLSNQLVSKLKVGDKFKKDDVLAYDAKFFKDTMFGNKFCIGSLEKVACMSEYSTFEDSTFITEEAAEDMETEITKDHPVVIGKNATVQSMVKVGDEVLVGDELITFEKSFEEETLNKLLGNIGEEIKEEVVTRGRNKVKSHYSGVVEAIEIYSGSDLEDLSPSLQKIVGDYWRGIKKKEKLLDKYSKDKNPVYKCGVLVNEACGKIESRDGKIKGQIVNDGVLIIFYIKYKDIVTIGDKITFFTALKGTIGDVIPRGYEPYTLDKPDEKIGLAVAPAAVLARMTPSILITMLGYKVLIGLKEKLKKIYER